MASFFDPAVFVITADATAALATFKEVDASLADMSASADTAGASLTNVEKASKLSGAAMAAVGVAAVGLAKYAIDAATQTQVAFSRLDQALQNTGNSSEATKKQMEGVADAATNLGFKATDAATALGTLVTATGSTKDAQQLMGTAMDYARYKGIDLGTAATTLARATQGSAVAFKALGITLDTHLPKQEAINKAMDEFQQKVQGQASAYMKTFAGQMSELSANAEKLAAKVGDVLIPIIDDVIKFFKTFGNEILIVGGAILTVMAAFKAYEIVMNVFKAAQIVYIAVTTGMAAAQTALTFATEGGEVATASMTVAQWALNAALDANPIGLVVIAVAALAAGFIVLWNHSKTFRDIVIAVAKAGVEAFGWIVGAVGDVVMAIVKLEEGPLKAILGAFSHLPIVGGAAKSALKDISTATNDVGNFFQDTKKSIDGFGNSLDSLANKKIELPGFGGSSSSSTDTSDSSYNLDNYTGGTASSSKAATAAAKRAAEIKKYNDQIVTLQDDMDKDLKDRQDKMTAAQQTFDDAKLAATTAFQNTSQDLTTTYNDAMTAAQTAKDDADLAAQTAYQDAATKAQQDFQDKSATALKNYNDQVASLQQQAADQATKLQQDAATKQQDIVNQSIALLTNAWAQATNTDVGSMFTGGANTASSLLTSLQTQLASIQQLQTDAGKLAGAGYTQAFIQQVLALGPSVGDQMAQQLLNASPATQSAIQSTFSDIQSVSADGLDSLAQQMNSGGVLATQALTNQYNQVTTDLQTALAANQTALNDSLATAQTTYNQALADAQTALDNAMESAADTRDKALTSAQDTYNKAVTSASNTLNNGMVVANDTLTKALTSATDTFNKSVASISQTTMNQLDALQTKIEATAAAIASLGGNTSTATGLESQINALTGGAGNTQDNQTAADQAAAINYNVQVNGYDLSDPNATAQALTTMISNGQTQGVSLTPVVIAGGGKGMVTM